MNHFQFICVYMFALVEHETMKYEFQKKTQAYTQKCQYFIFLTSAVMSKYRAVSNLNSLQIRETTPEITQ